MVLLLAALSCPCCYYGTHTGHQAGGGGGGSGYRISIAAAIQRRNCLYEEQL